MIVILLELYTPVNSFAFPEFAGVRVHNVCPQALQCTAKGQVLPKIHFVAEWRSILRLDASVTEERFKHHLHTHTHARTDRNIFISSN